MAYIKRDPFPISGLIKSNKDKIQTNLDDFSNAKVESKLYQLKHELNINDDYSINLNEFKGRVFPRLSELLSTTSALMLLQLILYNDYKIQKSQLIKSALKASLVPQLVNIYETTRDIQTKQLVINLFSVFCLSFESNPKLRKHVLNNNVVIDSILSQTDAATDSNEFIKDSLLTIQCLIYYSPNFETCQVLSPLMNLLKHKDSVIISESCYALFIFSERFPKSRQLLVTSNAMKKLLNLWVDNIDEELIVKPLFGLITGILVRLPQHKTLLLGDDIDILQIMPKLANSNQLNKIYATSLIKYIAMKTAFSTQQSKPTKEIQLLIDKNIIDLIYDLIQSDESLKVKRCAVNAMFVTAYNADVKDQLTPLAKGCLPVLCSQLDTNDKEYLNLVLLTIISFLFWEFKAFLGKEKKLLTSEDTLSPFAVIIQDCDGLQRLNQINGHRRDKESNNKYYMPTQEERWVEEILALAFHVETRPLERKQSVYVLHTFPGVNARVKQQQCLGCKKEMDAQKKFVRADTTIFSCRHLILCRGCAVKGVTKMYNQESDLPTCKSYKCGGGIPEDIPWMMFVDSLVGYYFELKARVEQQFENVDFIKLNH